MAHRASATMRQEPPSLPPSPRPTGFRLSDAELEIAWLILHDPAEYDRRLESYFRLLAENRAWWRCCMEADDPRWPDCIRDAIATIAREQGIPTRKAADFLDGDDFPRTRHRVLEIARKALHDRGAA